MEGITVLLAALALGAKAVSKPIAEQSVRDAYNGLKALIVRKFGGQEAALEQRLKDHEQDPETFEKPTEKVLQTVGAADDQEIIDRATELLQRLERNEPGVTGDLVGQINAQGGKVVVVKGSVQNVNLGPVTIYAQGSEPVSSRLGKETHADLELFRNMRDKGEISTKVLDQITLDVLRAKFVPGAS